MKRIVKLLIAVSLLFSMAGCSKNNDDIEAEHKEVSICGEKKQVVGNVTYYINRDFEHQNSDGIEEYYTIDTGLPSLKISNEEFEDATKFMTEDQENFISQLDDTYMSHYTFDTLQFIIYQQFM